MSANGRKSVGDEDSFAVGGEYVRVDSAGSNDAVPQERAARYQKIVLLTDGYSGPATAKTAMSMLRYRPHDIVAVVDASEAGKTAEEVFASGGHIPIVESVLAIPDADALFLGTASAGGKLPLSWRPIILRAIDRGLDIVAGLHDFLSEDDEFVAAAKVTGSRLVDVRKNQLKEVAVAAEFQPDCLRIHAVGQDCCVGKMTACLEIEEGLLKRGYDARFLATGQTGIMVREIGVPIDCVVADFVSGAAERLVLSNQSHDIVLVEGQGSITHPSFSAVTLGLLHGCAPQGLILCYEPGRTSHKNLPHVPTTSLADLVKLYERLAAIRCPCPVIGVAVNTRSLDREEATAECERVTAELGLPACDVFRDGADALVEAVVQLKQQTSSDRISTSEVSGCVAVGASSAGGA